MQKLNNWPKWFLAMGKQKALSLKGLVKDPYSQKLNTRKISNS